MFFSLYCKFVDSRTKIIFDDYVNRPQYHFVEKYVSRINECGRQCLFVVPSKSEIDMDSLNKDIDFSDMLWIEIERNIIQNIFLFEKNLIKLIKISNANFYKVSAKRKRYLKSFIKDKSNF